MAMRLFAPSSVRRLGPLTILAIVLCGALVTPVHAQTTPTASRYQYHLVSLKAALPALVSFSWVGFLTRIGRHTVPCRVSGCRGQDHRNRERCARIQGMAEGPSCRTDDG